MKMEILLEPTSNKLMVDPHGLEDSYKDGVEVPDSSCYSRQVKIHSHMLIPDRQIDEVLKLKTSRNMTIKAFKEQERYEHVGPKVTSSQDGKRSQVDDKRLFLVDDLKVFKITLDAIFDENRFSSVPRPILRIPIGTKDIGGTRDEVSYQHSYCFNVEDDPKTYKAIKSQDVSFWKEAINDEMYFIMGNNTWVLVDLPPGCKPLSCKWIFKRKLKVDGTIEKFKARLVIQGFRQKSRIKYFDTYALVVRISTIKLLIAMASIHNLIIPQMDVKTAFLNYELEEEVYMNQPQGFIMPGNENNVCKLIKSLYGLKQAPKPDIAFAMGKLSRYTSNPGTQHWQSIQRVLKYLKKTMYYILTYTSYPSVLESYTDASLISNTEDNSSISGWVFLLGGGAISWASEKQTCITGSTMESEFVALAAAGKEAEWLKNLLFEILLWSKPIAPISIHYDSASTLAKAYSHVTTRVLRRV
ncbi:zinc finger, CCHC-type containing protein [Tanacetum coccineum]